MRPWNTSVIRRVMSVSRPSQWNGSEPRSPPACSDCVRRSPWQVNFQTRPSSLPSAWHDAQARKPPAFEWKIMWPVSLRLTDESGIVLLKPGSDSIAGSRDWTTTWPSPANATAIGSPTVCGTDGSGTPQVVGGGTEPEPPVPVIVSGGAVPLEPPAPVPPVDSSGANSGKPTPLP